MSNFINKTKHTSSFKNKNKGGLGTWGDTQSTWGDKVTTWGGVKNVFTNLVKHISSFTNKTKN